MIPTVPFIQQTFERFNPLCFEARLPAVPIVLSKARSFLGKMEYKSMKGFFGRRYSCYDYRLKISTSFDLPETEWEDVIIHEMIHYYIAICGIRDSSAHGPRFRQMMDGINARHGRHITISHRLSSRPDTGIADCGKIRKHHVCVTTFKDGNMGITVCAATRISEISRLLPVYYSIDRMEWYESMNPFFNRYPRSRTPRIYKITASELSGQLEDALPLNRASCAGNSSITDDPEDLYAFIE